MYYSCNAEKACEGGWRHGVVSIVRLYLRHGHELMGTTRQCPSLSVTCCVYSRSVSGRCPFERPAPSTPPPVD